MAYADLHEHGSESAVKAAGKLRQQGKPYESMWDIFRFFMVANRILFSGRRRYRLLEVRPVTGGVHSGPCSCYTYYESITITILASWICVPLIVWIIRAVSLKIWDMAYACYEPNLVSYETRVQYLPLVLHFYSKGPSCSPVDDHEHFYIATTSAC
jgi:hypothetical protein